MAVNEIPSKKQKNPGFVFRPQNSGFRAKMLNGSHGAVPYITVQQNQNVFDLSMQVFGDIESVYYLIVNNQMESASTLPVPATNILYNPTGIGNELMKKEIKTKGIVFGNGQSAGSYNENFNTDFD